MGSFLEEARRRVDGVRWVREDALHLSLHFFGTISEAEVARVLASVTPVAARSAAFDVTLGGLGIFGEPGRERVLWVGVVAGAEALSALAVSCQSALRQVGFAVEERPFVAHCTLGRPRPRWPTAARRAWERLPCPALPPFRVERLVLYESLLQPGGSRYVEHAVLPLAG